MTTTTWSTRNKAPEPTAARDVTTPAVSGGAASPSGDSRVSTPAWIDQGHDARPQQPLREAIRRSATFSADLQFRYQLWRSWSADLPTMAVIGLNPSTADDRADDPTTRRMIGFAAAAGYGRLVMINLYGLRSPAPSVLRHVSDPIGPENDHWIRNAVQQAERVVAAWGTHAEPARAAAVLQMLEHHTVWCLGLTKDRCPRHPLYVPARTLLQPYARPQHDWSSWRRIIDPGVQEPLIERSCDTCNSDEVTVDDSVGPTHGAE